MVELFNSISDNLNYWWVFFFMTIESSFIPFPSEIVMIPAALLAVSDEASGMTVPMIIVVGTLGALLGALINYGLSVWLGRPIIYKFADSKIGHLLLIDRPGVEKAEKYFQDHGVIGTLIGRLIPAIRQLISIPAGLSRMKMSAFVVCTLLGAGIWNTFLAVLGATLGTTMGKDELIAVIEKYSGYIKAGLVVLVVVGLIIYIYKVIKANKATAAARKKEQE